MPTPQTITVEITVNGAIDKIWKLWTSPPDIMQWNNVADDWHTTLVESDLKKGGSFLFKMGKKDGSFGFDFAGRYDKVVTNNSIDTTSDNRKTINTFTALNDVVIITETFEPEKQTPFETQKQFCQDILNRFKTYAEGYNAV